MNKYKFLIFLLVFNSTAYSQKWYKKAKVYSGVGFIAGTDSLSPFLIRSNQFGTLLNTSNFIYFNGGIKKQYDSLYTINKKLKKFDYGYGIEGHVNIGRTQDFRLPEAYAKIRFGVFELYGGRRREIQGLVDTLGTMGSYIWSGNALPLPKIEVSIPNYTPIIGKGLISIKGNFAHGWFGDADSVKNYWLHQKSFYARVGRPSWKVKFYGGFNHQVQWGGRPAKPFYDPISNQTISKFGSDFATFVKVATGLSLAKGPNDWTSQTGIPANEASNRSGNHLGTVDIGLEFYLNKSKVFIYRQNIYEDGSLYYLNNIIDGLNGISIQLKNRLLVKRITFEFLNTSNQGGNYFLNIPQLRGNDNYFGNTIYKDGWFFKGKVIGVPIIEKLNNSPGELLNRIKSYQINTVFNFLKIQEILTLKYSSSNTSLRSIKNINQFDFLICLEKSYKRIKYSTKFELQRINNNNNIFGLCANINKSIK